jgi:1-deoxy-D-xylulose-5-phosphate reductoisomerase
LDNDFWKYFYLMKKKICILGSTGSIGSSTLEIISKDKKNFEVILLSGNNNFKLLISQAEKFKPKYIYSNNLILTEKISFFCKKNKIEIISDLNLLKKIKFDITVSAISGIAGLLPTLNIIKFSKKILIANKESIICGWKFISKELKNYKCKFIPIDSEHFSIYNLIKNKNKNSIKNIYLTASGGPFYKKKINFKEITPSQAVKHPNWKMGKKISVDSATLMNKVLEVIEASLIFDLPISKFKIVIQPESLIHAIIEFNNGLTSMLYHYNDMKIPIANSLNSHFSFKDTQKNRFLFYKKNLEKLFFYKIKKKEFPSIKMLHTQSLLNQTGYIIINSINEILVEKFLRKKILYPDIVRILYSFLKSKAVKNHLKETRIQHINDVFITYNFCKKLLNK